MGAPDTGAPPHLAQKVHIQHQIKANGKPRSARRSIRVIYAADPPLFAFMLSLYAFPNNSNSNTQNAQRTEKT
jgi:hypothetical protein